MDTIAYGKEHAPACDYIRGGAACNCSTIQSPGGQSLGVILAQRGQRYGKFTGHARLSQRLKQVMRGHQTEVDGVDRTTFNHLASDQIEALEMLAHKVARILNGDPNDADSWRDIAGYATLVADRLDGKGEQ